MKFHNAPVAGYAGGMNPVASHAMLARMRSSARLAMLVLLVFALKIGAAAACAKHDFADLGFDTDVGHAAVLKAPAGDGPDELTKGTLAQAGACSHCSCHHAVAVVPEIYISFSVPPLGVAELLAAAPPSVSWRLELRPPIA